MDETCTFTYHNSIDESIGYIFFKHKNTNQVVLATVCNVREKEKSIV